MFARPNRVIIVRAMNFLNMINSGREAERQDHKERSDQSGIYGPCQSFSNKNPRNKIEKSCIQQRVK